MSAALVTDECRCAARSDELSIVASVEPQPLSIRDKVQIVEAEMLKREQIEIPVRHYFSQGCVYAREITIPAGTLLTGKIHKHEQLNILSKGEISVLTDDGMKTVKAPFTIVSPPGTKRIAYAHSDSVWTTIHGTQETDLEKIEEHFIAQSEQEYAEFVERLNVKELSVNDSKDWM